MPTTLEELYEDAFAKLRILEAMDARNGAGPLSIEERVARDLERERARIAYDVAAVRYRGAVTAEALKEPA